MFKKIITLALMVFPLLAFSLQHNEPIRDTTIKSETVNNDISTFSTGTGTETDPILISTIDDFIAINDDITAKTTSGKYYTLSNDITYTYDATSTKYNGLLMLGTSTSWDFSGVFNGNGYTLNIDYGKEQIASTNSFYDTFGLFKQLNSGTVKNLNIVYVNGLNLKLTLSECDTYICLGLLAAKTVGTCVVDNCQIILKGPMVYDIDISSTTGTKYAIVGGFFAHLINAITVTNCLLIYDTFTYNTTLTSNIIIGGMVGRSSADKTQDIKNCAVMRYSTSVNYATFNLSSTATSFSFGYLIGDTNHYYCKFYNCFTNIRLGTASGTNGQKGYLIGNAGYTTYFYNCYHTQTETTDYATSGNNNADATDCDITTTSADPFGATSNSSTLIVELNKQKTDTNGYLEWLNSASGIMFAGSRGINFINESTVETIIKATDGTSLSDAIGSNTYYTSDNFNGYYIIDTSSTTPAYTRVINKDKTMTTAAANVVIANNLDLYMLSLVTFKTSLSLNYTYKDSNYTFNSMTLNCKLDTISTTNSTYYGALSLVQTTSSSTSYKFADGATSITFTAPAADDTAGVTLVNAAKFVHKIKDQNGDDCGKATVSVLSTLTSIIDTYATNKFVGYEIFEAFYTEVQNAPLG